MSALLLSIPEAGSGFPLSSTPNLAWSVGSQNSPLQREGVEPFFQERRAQCAGYDAKDHISHGGHGATTLQLVCAIRVFSCSQQPGLWEPAGRRPNLCMLYFFLHAAPGLLLTALMGGLTL